MTSLSDLGSFDLLGELVSLEGFSLVENADVFEIDLVGKKLVTPRRTKRINSHLMLCVHLLPKRTWCTGSMGKCISPILANP
jgi:hypothetical protein